MNSLRYKTIAEADSYLAFPDVAGTADDVLVCCYFEGDQHSPNWSQVVIRRSLDQGESWLPAQILCRASLEKDGYCWNCPRISGLQDGSLILICDYEDRSKEQAMWAWRSKDKGESWSQPTLIMRRGLVPDRVVSLASGRLLLVVPCQADGLVLFSSDDSGASWDELSQMRPSVEPRSAESSLVVLDEKRMVCYSRDGNALGPKTISLDGGCTWNDKSMSIFAGHRPCAGLLKSGKVLVTSRRPGAGTYAYLENQDSAMNPDCWTQRAGVLRLDDAGANHFWDYGYSGWVQLADGRIFCVYYTKPAPQYLPSPFKRPLIKGVWFSEEDFPVLREPTRNA